MKELVYAVVEDTSEKENDLKAVRFKVEVYLQQFSNFLQGENIVYIVHSTVVCYYASLTVVVGQRCAKTFRSHDMWGHL